MSKYQIEEKKFYVVHTKQGYWVGAYIFSEQLRKAKIYTSLRYANETAERLNRGDFCATVLEVEICLADYRKQNEGEWKHPPYAPFGGSYEMKRCSVCGYKPDFDSDNPYTKFCPYCGAKMKGGGE